VRCDGHQLGRTTLAVLLVSAYAKLGRMIPSGRTSFVRCIDGPLPIIRINALTTGSLTLQLPSG
jgi:hypothetical protein